MKIRNIITIALLLFGCGEIYAQTGVIPVYACVNPGVKAVTSGVSSSNYLQGVIPTCTVTVFLTGTVTKAVIYKDSLNTPQNNPFQANTNGSIPPIYAATGQAYDVQLSGGITPNTYAIPVTLTGLNNGGVGSGGVTRIIAGTNVTISPSGGTGNVTVNAATGSGITQLTQDVLAGPGSGSQVATVNGFQGQPIDTTAPVLNSLYWWNGSIFHDSPLTLDQIGPAFAISSFTCSTCSTYEIGFTVASPTNFTASYSSPAASASINDGTNTDTLSSPFTSGSLAFSYTQSTAACTTYTLTAIAATTKTATRQSCWVPRAFGGTGTGGSATSATASGNNAVLVGATGTLTISYLGNSCTGQVYNVTTSGTQYVYLLLPCNVSNPSGGSFTTPGPTVFQMNAPTTISFPNQYGPVLTMYLYRSTNSFVNGTNNIITAGN